MDVPGTAVQLLIALLFVVPGSVFQAARARLRGPTPHDTDASSRLLRALAVSAFLDAVYAVVFGPTLVRLAQAENGNYEATAFLRQVRTAGWYALVLLFVIPVGLAIVDYVRAKWRWGPRVSYDPTPRAWDFGFYGIGPTYVRVLTADGTWLGGWYGPNSFVSSFPEPREMFIEIAHVMGPNGEFGPEQPGSNGMYVRCDDVRAVEFVDGGRPAGDTGSGDGDGSP